MLTKRSGSSGKMRSIVAAELSLLMALLLGGDGSRTVAQPPSPSRPMRNCQTFCGDLTVIPYPFGIAREGCFLNEWYEIVCHGNMTTPILKRIGLEVKNISLPDYNAIEPREATIHVSLPVVPSSDSCSLTNQSRKGPPSLDGSPFVYSISRNTLLAVGCNYTGRLLSVIHENNTVD